MGVRATVHAVDALLPDDAVTWTVSVQVIGVQRPPELLQLVMMPVMELVELELTVTVSPSVKDELLKLPVVIEKLLLPVPGVTLDVVVMAVDWPRLTVESLL